MGYIVDVVPVEEQLLAVSRQRTNLKRISKEFKGLLDNVSRFLKDNPDLRTDGHNVVVNHESVEGIDIEVGVQVVKGFESTEAVVLSSTPGGTAARTVHFGPYSELGAAYEAIQAYCEQNELPISDISWEVYGDWDKDPKKRRTDVYYMLR